MIRKCIRGTYGSDPKYADCLMENAREYKKLGNRSKAKDLFQQAASEYESCNPPHGKKAQEARKEANSI